MRQEILVQFLGQEDLLEEGMAVHFSILVWGIPWTEESEGPIRSQSILLVIKAVNAAVC